jgi:hypothetical protein
MASLMPSVKSEVPLTIEWGHEFSARVPINEFEQQRSKHVRERHAAGHSDEEVKEAAHHGSRDRRNRRIMTYTWCEITSAVNLSTEIATCWIERFEASSASMMHKMISPPFLLLIYFKCRLRMCMLWRGR